MRKKGLLIVLAIACLSPVLLTAQSSIKGSAVNGATGIIVSPTARIGWEYSDFGVDFGYSFLYSGGMRHVPTVTFSLVKKVELGIAMDIHDDSLWNMLIHAKFQFYKEGGSSLAMGLITDLAETGGGRLGVFMTPYIVASFSGDFFTWPAVTSMMFGWHLLEDGVVTSNFAFSMGFEMALIPSVFREYIYLISDFSNYSYASNSLINAGGRGAFNIGIRIDPIKKGRFKLVFDVVGTDLLDAGRGFMASATFGFGI